MKPFSSLFPLSLSVDEAEVILRDKPLRDVETAFVRNLLEKNPTPLEAQAVLIEAWEVILKDARFSCCPGDVGSCGVKGGLYLCKQQDEDEPSPDQRALEIMKVPKDALICAARHFIAAHESAKLNHPVDFGRPCLECPIRLTCKADWIKTAAPIFEAAGVFPNLLGTD